MEKPDAGLRGIDYYKARLPWWRYAPRQRLIPLVRWETPYLAALQKAFRTSTLDSYFAVTANLGTHTFFMIGLPILFWCGYTGLGRGMVHILASGVFFSGFVKDLLCLPRPLSPPLHRITMSGSVALEYGFPSTHSTNAVSVAVYVLLSLRSATATIMPATKIFLEALAYFYATSIVVGRLYCGMHGFLDVIVGGFLGAGLSFIQFFYVDTFDAFITNGHYTAITITVLIILVLVRIHPEPADDCPCFDDSVAFAGVLCGVEAGKWHFSMTQYSSDVPCPGTVPFDLQTMGWITTMLRIVVGVLMIFAWKEVAKPTLLKALPPVFRIVERLGLSLPRKFFKQASEYDQVPSHLKTDSLMPSVSEIPNFISSISHPRRDRSISIGPQSTADAREALFFRQKRRRDSRASSSSLSKTDRMIFDASDASEKPEVLRPPIRSSKPHTSLNLLPTPVSSDLNLAGSSENEAALPTTLTPSDSNQNLNAIGRISRTPSQDSRENEKEERELFSQLPTPRVRYDVEVITKLVVYAGIGWLAVEGDPILFHYLGLGMKK